MNMLLAPTSSLAVGVVSIEPVDVGGRVADSSMFLHLTDPGVPIPITYRLWLLRTAGQTIVVDTGPPVVEAYRRGITSVQHVDALLAARHVDSAAIETVILTHLHWDHAANAECFPNARFLAQRREIEFFSGPLRKHRAMDRFFSHHAMIERLAVDGRLQPVDGEAQIAPGVTVMRVGGHTPGSQIVVAETATGRAVISGDSIPLNRNFTDDIPSGILVNIEESIAALDLVRKLRPRFLFTGHDPQTYLECVN